MNIKLLVGFVIGIGLSSVFYWNYFSETNNGIQFVVFFASLISFLAGFKTPELTTNYRLGGIESVVNEASIPSSFTVGLATGMTPVSIAASIWIFWKLATFLIIPMFWG